MHVTPTNASAVGSVMSRELLTLQKLATGSHKTLAQLFHVIIVDALDKTDWLLKSWDV